MEAKDFQEKLYAWASAFPRELPWKGIKNPYHIWLSEIILQQTRVEQGLPYYEKFISKYPTVKDLADAPEDAVMKCWEGLGYYSRARNLHSAAKYVTYDCNNNFPDSYENLLKMKGVGKYTAAAIASFAFDLPHAVVDGNVYRVLARIFGIQTPIDIPSGQKEFQILAQKLLDLNQPARYNQSIMDFGSTHCTPKNPFCSTCVFNTICIGYNSKKTKELPRKSKEIIKKTRYFNYFIFSYDNKIIIKKRIEKDIWQNLYDFPLFETNELIDDISNLNIDFLEDRKNILSIKKSKPFRHILTHQEIIAQFFEIELSTFFQFKNPELILIEIGEIKKFAFPKLIDLYISEKNVSLTLF